MNRDEPKTCKDLANVAQGVLDKFRKADKKTADGYVDFPFIMVHEMTHTNVGGRAKVSISPPWPSNQGLYTA